MSDNPYILLVEDEESFADALTVGLTREGFDVEWVADGVSAIEAFERKTPNLVLLDVMLPNMSGLDVCRLIRLKSEVPIVMVTAKTEEVDAVVALELGADDYVTKPYQFRELVARVRAILRRAEARNQDKAIENVNIICAHLGNGASVACALQARVIDAQQAIVSYQRAIELNPACADYHFNLGNAHYALGQAPAARSSFSAATTLDPQLAAAHFNLGQVAQDEGDHLAAAQSYKRAVDLDFHYVDALVNLGLTLKELGQSELTRECFELILQKQTGHPMAGVNLAKFHLEQNHPPAAEAACRSVLEVHPTHAEALLNLGVALQAQNRTLDAIAAYEEIVAHNPDYPDRQFNIAFSELMAGRWQSGWQHYEARWGTDNPVFTAKHPHIQNWNGESLAGKRLLFFAEQGYGDTLQFCLSMTHY